MNASSKQRLARGLVALTAALLLAACSRGSGSEAEQIASAKEMLEKKDSKAALIHLKNALQKNPQSAQARFLLGKTLLDSGDAVSGMVELLKAQELQLADEVVIPEIAHAMLAVGDEGKLLAQYGDTVLKDATANADLRTSMATAYAVKGDMEGARKAVADALRATAGYAPAVIVQARLAAADGDLDGALKLLDQVLASDAGNDRAGGLKGEYLLIGKRDPEAAMAAYRQVLAAKPGSVAARAAAAGILIQQKKVPEARAEFVQLKKTAPDHPETLLIEAQLAFIDADSKHVREITERMLKAFPNNVRVLELAGANELRAKNYLLAEAQLSLASKLAPKLLRPRVLLAQTFSASGQPEKALELLQPIIESPQADANSLALAGEAYLQTGDAKRSEEAFKRAMKIAPTNAVVRTTAAIAQLTRSESNPAALAELESAAGSDTGPRADLALISARLRQNDLTGALKAIDALEKKLPDRALAPLLRGRVLMLKKDNAGAQRSFEAAAAKEPAYFPAVASLAAIDLAAGKAEGARQRFETFLKENPKSYQTKLALAELDARTGAPMATVVKSLREAVTLNGNEATPRVLLVNQLLNSGEGKAALLAAEEAAAALPNNLEIQDALGRAQVQAGDPLRAVSTFNKLLSLKPNNTSFMLHLASAQRANKDMDAAKHTLQQALALQPELVTARAALVSLAVDNKRYDEALALARELQKRSPKEVAGFQLEGEIEAGRRNWDGAAAAFRAAAQRQRSATMIVKLHAALSNGGKTAEADRLAADWTKESPQDVVFPFYQGDVAMNRKDYVTAEARYRLVLERQPNNALAMNNIAWMLASQNKAGAVAMAEKANGLLPNRAPLLDTLALALEGEKQLPMAIETQLRATKLDPDDPNLSLRLAKLYLKNGDKPRARAELESLAKLGDRFGAQAEVDSLLKTL